MTTSPPTPLQRTLAVMQAFQQRNATLLQPYGGSAPERLSAKVTTLPRGITIPGPATWDQATMGERRHCRRQYRIQILTGLVDDAGDDALIAAVNLLDVFSAGYLADDVIALPVDGFQALISADGSRNGASPRDSGLIIFTIGSTRYHGFELTIPVDEYWDDVSS